MICWTHTWDDVAAIKFVLETVYLATVGDALSEPIQNYPINHPDKLGTLPSKKKIPMAATRGWRH